MRDSAMQLSINGPIDECEAMAMAMTASVRTAFLEEANVKRLSSTARPPTAAVGLAAQTTDGQTAGDPAADDNQADDVARGWNGGGSAEAWLHCHNWRRALHEDTPALVWDETVAALAQQHADTCPQARSASAARPELEPLLPSACCATCLAQDHSNNGNGENLCWGYGDHGAMECCKRWYEEIENYSWEDGWRRRNSTV